MFGRKRKSEKSVSQNSELEAAKLEAMRIRFRRVLGEAVPAHKIKQVRKEIAKCTAKRANELGGENA